MRLSILVALSLLLLQSCGSKTIDPNSVEGRLVANINKSCRSSNVCTIRVRDATNFDWDKMYVFKYTANRDEIVKVIGSPLPRYNEFKRKLIFVSGGKLAYSEEEPTDIESVINEQIVFGIPDNESYREFGSDPVFEVTKKNFSRGVYYEFKLVR
jgi:hypothetical protein